MINSYTFRLIRWYLMGHFPQWASKFNDESQDVMFELLLLKILLL